MYMYKIVSYVLGRCSIGSRANPGSSPSPRILEIVKAYTVVLTLKNTQYSNSGRPQGINTPGGAVTRQRHRYGRSERTAVTSVKISPRAKEHMCGLSRTDWVNPPYMLRWCHTFETPGESTTQANSMSVSDFLEVRFPNFLKISEIWTHRDCVHTKHAQLQHHDSHLPRANGCQRRAAPTQGDALRHPRTLL